MIFHLPSCEGKTATFDVSLSNIDYTSNETKSFTVHVDDPALVAITDGIVRGMSGSPIIKAIRIEKLAYQGECRRLLLGGLPWGQTQCEAPRARSALAPIGVSFGTASSSAR